MKDMGEKLDARVRVDGGVIGAMAEGLDIEGIYTFKCTGPVESRRAEYVALRDMIGRIESGNGFARLYEKYVGKSAAKARAKLAEIPLEEKWTDTIHNLVTTVGKNHILDNYLAGSAFTTVGPYMGLISNVSWSAVNAADTMSSHAGWTEAGGTNAPTYTSPRKTLAFNSASAGVKALSSNPAYAITSGSNVIIKGAFVATGSGALSTIDNTAGTLLSAGAFSGGDKTVSNGDSLTVSWQLGL